MNSDQKNKVFSILGILILLISIIGISYALYRFNGQGNTQNYVTTGTVSMQYTESDSNVISIDGAMPMKDEVGKKQKDYFDFSLSSSIKGEASITYEIRAKQLPASTKKELSPKNVKVYLEKKEDGEYKEVLAPTSFSINDKSVIENDTLDKNTMLLYTGKFSNNRKLNNYSDDYRLRMWISDDAIISDEKEGFKLRVDVYASID